VERGNEQALADAVAALLEPDRWRTFSALALDAARQYRLDAHLEELRGIVTGKTTGTAGDGAGTVEEAIDE
jgi:hypothetical protein